MNFVKKYYILIIFVFLGTFSIAGMLALCSYIEDSRPASHLEVTLILDDIEQFPEIAAMVKDAACDGTFTRGEWMEINKRSNELKVKATLDGSICK